MLQFNYLVKIILLVSTEENLVLSKTTIGTSPTWATQFSCDKWSTHTPCV